MVTSPTGKGGVLIGGAVTPEVHITESDFQSMTGSELENLRTFLMTLTGSDKLYELSGESMETLKWSILDQKLKYGRHGHVAITISDDIASSLITKQCKTEEDIGVVGSFHSSKESLYRQEMLYFLKNK